MTKKKVNGCKKAFAQVRGGIAWAFEWNLKCAFMAAFAFALMQLLLWVS